MSGWRYHAPFRTAGRRQRVLPVSLALPLLLVLLAVTTHSLSARAAEEALRAFAIRNSNSEQIAAVLKQVFNDDNLVLVSDVKTNTILVRANRERMNQIQMVVAQLDGAFAQRPQAIGQRNRPQPRPTGHEPNLDVQVLADRSVEIRAPADGDYWVRGLVVHEGTRVKKNQALMLLDNTDMTARELLLREIKLLRRHLASVETLIRQHRDGQTDSDKQELAKGAKRAAAIRAGIAEKTRQLNRLKEIEGHFVVPAEIDGIITFAQKIEEYCPNALPLKPHQLLLRIAPD